MAYSTSAASAGMAVGGFFFHILARVVGRPSAMLWSVVGLLLVQVWSASMTKGEDYTPFLVSRGFAGFFGPIIGVLGPQMLIDTFFLHQRGRAFTFFFFWFDLGTMAGPTLSGLIADRLGWQSGLWWTVILCGLSAGTIFCFLSGTTWNRSREPTVEAHRSARSWIRGRVDMFFPGSQTMPKTSVAELVSFITSLGRFSQLTSIGCHCIDSFQNRCHTRDNTGWPVQSAQFWLLYQHEQPHACLASDTGEQRWIWLQHKRDRPIFTASLDWSSPRPNLRSFGK